MTGDLVSDGLFFVQQGLLLLLYPMAAVLVVAAWRKPHIWALTIMAMSTVAIALGISAYQFAVTNAAAGYPVDREVSRIILRSALILIEALPLVFWFVYRTGRFRDE